jgi:hypothetical protein
MIAIHQVLTKIKNLPLKKIVQGSLLIILLPNLNQIKDIELNDYSGNKELYNFLKSLPKDSMIAAHPSLADAVPTFSQRKVFVKHELSHPWMEPYWETVKSRTFDFFKIYYSDNLDEAFTLCQANDIDYLVVDRSHFSEDYFNGRIYFEPFLSYIRKSFKGRGSFALLKISDKDKLYDKKGIFIISTDALKV